jgi:menaquinone-dependent protoporphyrinogen oxidase
MNAAPSIRIVYGTSEGQTARVADHIAETLRAAGHDAAALNVDALPAGFDPAAHDAVVVGASVHGGTHQRAVRTFVDANRETLAGRPSAFFQVCLTAAIEDERADEAETYVEQFLETTGWQPDRVGNFAGALRYTEFGFLKKQVLKRVVREFTGDTDTSRDYEYTDWTAVDAFARDVAGLVEHRPPAPASAADRDEAR